MTTSISRDRVCCPGTCPVHHTLVDTLVKRCRSVSNCRRWGGSLVYVFFAQPLVTICSPFSRNEVCASACGQCPFTGSVVWNWSPSIGHGESVTRFYCQGCSLGWSSPWMVGPLLCLLALECKVVAVNLCRHWVGSNTQNIDKKCCPSWCAKGLSVAESKMSSLCWEVN